MDSFAALPQPVVDALARGWTVITGNQRAARTLRRSFDLRQRALGHSHWQPADILAWDSWLAAQWRRLLLEGHASSLLLNSTQEHMLWRTVIAADPASLSLRPIDSLAELAADAWDRLCSYGGAHRLKSTANTADTRAFVRWANEFERRCQSAQYLPAAELPEKLRTAISSGQITLPRGFLLVGFDAMTTIQQRLIASIRATGAEIEQFDPAAESEQTHSVPSLLLQAADSHAELRACARWLRERLAKDPNARIAVIVPDIAAERPAIERTFRGILAPEMQNITAPAENGPFEFSLGIPLDRTPMVATALDVLRWCAGPLSLDRVSALLLSPYFAATGRDVAASPQDELTARAEFDAFVLRDRPLLQPQITADELASLLSHPRSSSQLSDLRVHLRAFTAAVRRSALARDRSHAECSAVFQQMLDAAGWAPVAGLDSTEFQTRSKWESVLDELASLDFDPQSTRVSFKTALDALVRIASQTLFAPESRHAPVQIMGPLESAGSSFDALWFLRAGDLSWPPVPSLNPLLPYSLQRDFAMPGADIAGDTTHARHITHRIAASAADVVFSYARETADGRQRPSPLLATLSLQPAAVAHEDSEVVPIPLDSLLDTTPVPAPPAAALRGGASVLEAQAACAFRAFAERRLFSTPLDSVSLGLNMRDRGTIVHNVLHSFWTQVRSQAELRAMPTADRDALLTQCIESAIAREHANPSAGWATAYIKAERERLFRLLRPWLEFEATNRPPFVVKSSEEELQAVPIGPLHLNVRVDRIDETVPAISSEAPAEIILDYKTGFADPSGWEGDRPDAPQLPLYAVVSAAPQLAAIAFASIRPGKFMGLAGYQSQNGILPHAKRGQTLDLEVKREEWRQALTALAVDFHAGRALALPKDYPRTCRYCRQRLLCRLDPSSLAPSDDAIPDETNAYALEPETQA
jgi:ATP-dependent helicase/nuclease subunit B